MGTSSPDAARTNPSLPSDLPYFTPREVSLHRDPSNCWISLFHKVYDLTPLIQAHVGSPLIAPILAHAGRDITHWFDKETGSIKTYRCGETGLVLPYLPYGPVLDVVPIYPLTNPDVFWRRDLGKGDGGGKSGREWWRDDEKFRVGWLTEEPLWLRVVNGLSKTFTIFEVCVEESLLVIQNRYLRFNAHTHAYVWKHQHKVLDMSRSLPGNGVRVVRECQGRQGWTVQGKIGGEAEEEVERRLWWVPTIVLYWKDDLTQG